MGTGALHLRGCAPKVLGGMILLGIFCLGAGQNAQAPAPSLQPAVRHYDLNVTLVRGAPDCFEKTLLLANGQWGFPIEVTQGEILEVGFFFLSSMRCPMRPC